MNTVLGIVIVLVLISAYALVNSIEIAIVSANRIRVRHLAEGGRKTAQAIERLLASRERFFAAIVLLQNIFVVVASTMASLVGEKLAGGTGVLVGTLLVISTTVLFGELIPKVLASVASERFALVVALPTLGVVGLLAPVVYVLDRITAFVSRAVFGHAAEAGPSVTEAELRMLIGMSAEAGSVAEEEAELLDRVFHFGDRRTHEVMVPRTEAVFLARNATVREFYEVFGRDPHSRFPIYDGDPDHVVGVVGIKDVLRAIARGEMDESSSIESVMRPAYFVPETKTAGELFREMQASGMQMAIAVDEWGGTAGIVTLELLLEEMVGPVRDELRPSEPEITEIDEQTLEVDGSLSVDEAREELGMTIPDGPYDTMAGFVLDRLGHVPRVGESLALDGRRITVAVMKGPKIDLLRVTRA